MVRVRLDRGEAAENIVMNVRDRFGVGPWPTNQRRICHVMAVSRSIPAGFGSAGLCADQGGGVNLPLRIM
jgi:hypothetical protein